MNRYSMNLQLTRGRFYSIYHPQFPILPDIMTFAQQYNSNRLLLWSVLAISAGNSSVTSALYNSLVNPVRRLAGDIYSHQSRGLEAVQALLLLCAWPFPYQQTVNDPSPMYCSLATAIAHQIGLHRPPALSNDFDFQVDGPESSRVKVRDRERAWLGCFVMNYTISIRLGIPSPISSYRSISSAIAKEPPSHLADTLIGLVHVAYLGHKTTTALGDDASAPSGLVDDPARLIHFFDHDFQAACQSLHGKISSQCDVFLLHSRLTLYSYAFNDKGTQNPNQAYDVEKSELSGKALSAAMKLMQLACENFNASLRWPAFVKNCVIYATCLAAFIVSKVKQSEIEVKTIIDTCEAANSLIRLWSLFPKDNYSRISTHIARFIDSINQRTSFMMATPEDTRGGLARQTPVTSRMSANVMFNVIWPAKKAGMNGTAPTLGDEAQSVVHPLVNTMMEEEDAHDTGLPTQVNLGPMDTIDFGSFDDIFADWSDLLGNTT
ncbi:hypothetical protein, variant [Exophiala oligosperma]|uniref:Xylanolytic transcriptional activator regulatory domain-containing protein n=1 Tax=Exophiala oligosperma TaxID=215243 RepID=A0A0D2AH02_9EURO|nr:hypothetical protein, variant [Exophiala oligosperma]KIW39381.1 hypothetical protein, variant [Exophiala oligosperma]